MTMRLDIFCTSDIGCIRQGNQDMAAAGLNLVRDSQTDFMHEKREGDNFMLLVADGMGGHQHGEMASSHTLEELRAAIFDRNRDWSHPEATLSGEIERISTELNLKSVGMRLEKAMGCTLTGFVWAGGKTLLVNVGDSRCYRMRAGMLRLLTRDQNLSERDMVPMPQGKALYSCLGGGISPSISIQDYSGKLLPADRLLICSDGLTDMISENEIEALLKEGRPSQSGSMLVEAAKAAGGADNISVIVADLLDDAEYQSGDTLPAGTGETPVQEDAGLTDMEEENAAEAESRDIPEESCTDRNGENEYTDATPN